MCLHQLIWHVGIRTRRWLHSLASLHIKLAQYPLYLPDIYSRTNPRNQPTSWPQTYCYLSMATSLFSQYPTVVIEFCPQTLKRTSEREKINPWLLNHSSWPRSWTILYFFLLWHQMCQRHNLNLSQNQLFFPQDRSIPKETCRVNWIYLSCT